MSEKTFADPVMIKSPEGSIARIGRLEEALDFLYDWPENRRSSVYATAVRTCEQAFDEGRPLPAARRAFIGFAKSVGILIEDATPHPWQTQPPVHGGLPA